MSTHDTAAVDGRETAWLHDPIAVPDAQVEASARKRQSQLTKPPGSLGRLEALAQRLAGLQRRVLPRVDRVQISVFAADHGIADEGVSAFPQAVTAQMIANFAHGGAAISVMAQTLGATLEVIDLGTVVAGPPLPGVRHERIAAGTANFARAPAMTDAQLAQALHRGRAAALRAADAGVELFIGGDMGIANTSSATALACVLLGCAAATLAGPGTGLDAAGVMRKAAVIDAALARHALAPDAPLDALRSVGGFEIAALAASYVACAQRGIAVLVDGFIASAAALAATRLAPGCDAWLFYAHRSAEPGHRVLLEALQAEPLLDLGMRLGEGSGAAVAVPLLRSACALHAQMATFAEAGVADRA
ncbi:nicotinate-nucleotide--dimethylbenzimidazole phosphoribosyltransferase [Solimonas marina]|uniref:Nicotinate-nucleotide--dimethylbenzimidazole phosphoribosyltransferase n=1 Tax=Solimonas marina TaxID=2714601 RepID=A0A969W7N0_9GAMM|nr:nicotinate-nucleotide--dimethylbenzimidazole phosphoribosyltransferase [Solimonas marina]NKF21004.1 nicotinate-nucleotide--dimethylbenzimidazole phosphoribosyltransferase [Solimonas marina]